MELRFEPDRAVALYAREGFQKTEDVGPSRMIMARWGLAFWRVLSMI